MRDCRRIHRRALRDADNRRMLLRAGWHPHPNKSSSLLDVTLGLLGGRGVLLISSHRARKRGNRKSGRTATARQLDATTAQAEKDALKTPGPQDLKTSTHSGANFGSVTSSVTSSKTTRTGMPMRISRGATPTRLDVIFAPSASFTITTA